MENSMLGHRVLKFSDAEVELICRALIIAVNYYDQKGIHEYAKNKMEDIRELLNTDHFDILK